MTQHEKTRLIELLCSGDEELIRTAKRVCEEENRLDIIREVLDNELLPKSVKDAIYHFGFGINKSSLCNEKYIEAVMHMYQLDYYHSKHLQSSE